MPKKLGTVDRNVLTSAQLPAATKTYTVISHTYIIDTILQALEDNGFEVTAEEFKSTSDAKVASGAFMIQFNEDPDLTLCYTFNNSYDKSLRFRAAIGAYIDLNGSYMISDMDSWIRKHTGTADQEAYNLIQDHISNARTYYEELRMAKESMTEITITKAEFGGIIGEFFLKDILSVDQISYIKKEFLSPSYNYFNAPNIKTINLWTAYMIIADALKSSHPSKWMKCQTGVHLYFVTKYNLTDFDYDETTENEDPSMSDSNSEEDIDYATEESMIIAETVSDEDTHAEDTDNEKIILPGFEAFTPEPVLPCIGHAVESDEEEESTVEATEDEVVSQLYGVDNDIEVSIPVDEEEEEIEVEAELVDDIKIHIESDAEYNARVAAIEGEPELELPTTDQIIFEGLKAADDAKAEKEKTIDASDLIGTYTLDEMPAVIEKIQEKIDAVTEGNDSIEVEETAEAAETFYFMKEDYEGVSIGDYIEEDGQYFNVINDESGDDGDFWIAIAVDMDGDITDVEPEETTVQETGPEEEDWFNEQAFKGDDVTEEFSIEEEDDILVEAETPEPENTKLTDLIAEEVEELYGYRPKFTYKSVGSMYNVLLETGESFTLQASAIDHKL